MTSNRAAVATEPMSVENILRVYREASDSQVARGIAWYGDAHSFARALDSNNVSRSAGITAALSPRVSWERNMTLAARVYSDRFASGTLPDSCRKATAIFNGEETFSVLGGDKVRNFARCIIDPTDVIAVVIDRHAFDVTYGAITDDKSRGVLGLKGVYDYVASLYVEAAERAGISPCQMQAVTWVTWRENHANNRAANVRALNDE